MQAGFARVCINPPIGTKMLGWSGRDAEKGCTAIHDDLYVRALCVSHEGQEAIILAYDLCFPHRTDVDQFKGAIGRRIDIAPSRILTNASHTHAGPRLGMWGNSIYDSLDRRYADEAEAATVEAACRAREDMREATLHAVRAHTRVPLSRRRPEPDGTVSFAPYPDGFIHDALPICMLKGRDGKPVCLLFGIACHPSTAFGWEISADYPGYACRELDAWLGAAASMFLQGTGGDTKVCVIAGDKEWKRGTHQDAEKAGHMLAQEVMGAVKAGLHECRPAVRARSVEMQWPAEPAPGREAFEAVVSDSNSSELRRMWAQREIELLDRRGGFPTRVPVACHGIKLAEGVRIVGLEGEAVAGLGALIEGFYGNGVTFALGYTDGAQLYLPTEAMLEEGGYEVDSFWEYGFPSRLARGFEKELRDALMRLRASGVD